MATTAQRLAALEAAVKALTARVAALESPAPPTIPPPTPDPPTGPVTPPPGTVGVPAGTVLVPSGAITITAANTVIDGKDITGGVVVKAPGAVIRRCRIHGSGSGMGVWAVSGYVTIYDSEIHGFENGIGFDNWKAYRVDIHGCTGDGAKLGSHVVLQDSRIHDLTPAPGAHSDGAQLQFGAVDLVVRGSTIDLASTPNANAALFLAPDQGPSTAGPVLVEGNRLAGGNYTLYCVDGNNGQYVVSNITIRGNVIARGQYGSHNVNVPVTWSGNTTPDGKALPL